MGLLFGRRTGLLARIRNRILGRIITVAIISILSTLIAPLLGPLGPIVIEKISNWLFQLLNL